MNCVEGYEVIIGRMEDRIVEMAFKYVNGERKEVKEWLERIGAKVSRFNEDELLFTGPSGIKTGLYSNIDPVNATVCLAFAIGGIYWTMIFPNLVAKAGERWKEERKKIKDKEGAGKNETTIL